MLCEKDYKLTVEFLSIGFTRRLKLNNAKADTTKKVSPIGDTISLQYGVDRWAEEMKSRVRSFPAIRRYRVANERQRI